MDAFFGAWKKRDPTVSYHNLALNCQCVLTGICSGHFMLKALSEDPSACVCMSVLYPSKRTCRSPYVHAPSMFDKCSKANVDTWIRDIAEEGKG